MAGNDIRKAALLLLSLPEEEAAKLLSKLGPKQVESVSVEIAKIGNVAADEQEQAIKEFADVNPTSLSVGAGGLDLAKNLVEKAFGKGGASTLEVVRQQIEALPFGFLQRIDSQHLLTFIIDEHPQTIALILSHLPSQKAAEVIGGLPSERQLAVIRRVAHMGQTNPEIIQEVERGLSHRMSSVMSQQFETAGGVETVAEILNVTDRATERSLLENLAQEDPDLVEDIRRLMFVFEDISKFSNKDIQMVLKNVESSQWAMALKTASEDLKQKVMSNMSTRAAELLREEMEYLGPVRRSAVEQTQQQIVDVVRRLEDSGEITISNNDEAEELV
ncbi:MAG: flagellar motor switch protein FliG [Planctomycetes bacterium]|nr:flagellar motor switch protein FliG [Planctomycetota bacterium]